MKQNIFKVTTISAVALLALVGCASTQPTEAPQSTVTVTAAPTTPVASAEATEAPKVVATEASKAALDGDYTFVSSNNSKGVITLNAEEPAQAKYLREKVGGKKPIYISVEIDNTASEVDNNMYDLAFYRMDGTEYHATSVTDTYSEWMDLVDVVETDNTETYNKIVDLINETKYSVRPGKSGTLLLAVDKLPEEIAGVEVMAHGGMDMVEAFPAE